MKKVIALALTVGSLSLFAGAAHAGSCVEGRKGFFTEYDSNNDHQKTVVRTCVNGSYMTADEQAAYVRNPSTKCVEGRRSIFTEYDANTDHQKTVIRTCVNGSYMTAAEKAAYVRNPNVKCQEGRTEIWYENGPNDHQVMVRVKCVGGKYKKVN
jgi:hypothetical protein